MDELGRNQAGGLQSEPLQVTTGSWKQDVNLQATQGREDEAIVATRQSVEEDGQMRTTTAKVSSGDNNNVAMMDSFDKN